MARMRTSAISSTPVRSSVAMSAIARTTSAGSAGIGAAADASPKACTKPAARRIRSFVTFSMSSRNRSSLEAKLE